MQYQSKYDVIPFDLAGFPTQIALGARACVTDYC